MGCRARPVGLVTQRSSYPAVRAAATYLRRSAPMISGDLSRAQRAKCVRCSPTVSLPTPTAMDEKRTIIDQKDDPHAQHIFLQATQGCPRQHLLQLHMCCRTHPPQSTCPSCLTLQHVQVVPGARLGIASQAVRVVQQLQEQTLDVDECMGGPGPGRTTTSASQPSAQPPHLEDRLPVGLNVLQGCGQA